MSEGKPSSEKLVRSIIDSAQHIGTVTLTFLAVCVYIGIAVSATTHEVLLLGTSINLPLLNVQIPLDKFFILAPSLLVFLHLHLLILEYLLQCKIARFIRDANPPEEETDLFFASLPLSILLGQGHPSLIRGFLKVLSKGVTVAFPVLLLLATQVIFLPYHSVPITAWHKLLILLDIALIWYFFLRTSDLRIRALISPPRDRQESDHPEAWTIPGGLFVTFCLIGFSTVVAGGRAAGYEFRTGKFFPLTDLFAVDLSLIDRRLAADMPPVEGSSPRRGIQLIGRNLRGADFTDADLTNTDFRGADLTGAIFKNADLRNANFSPFRKVPRFEVPRRTTSETLVVMPTILRGADLSGARLARANLSRADLRRARLENSDLHGSDLSHADLRGANLRESDLVGANLSSARLLGADLWRASLLGASLREADLRGAKLIESTAIAADFSLAETLAADFREARLYFSHGLILRGADLSRARVGKVYESCGEGAILRSPKLSDLRDVDFNSAKDEEWEDILGSIEEKGEGDPVYSAVSDEIYTLRWKESDENANMAEEKKEPRLCLITLEQASDSFEEETLYPAQQRRHQIEKASLLYNTSPKTGPMVDWPPATIAESEYYTRLAKELVNRACQDYDLAITLIRGLSGEMASMRPLLAFAVALRMSDRLTDERDCAMLRSLSEEQRAAIERATKKDPLRTDDSPLGESSGPGPVF